MSDQHTPDPDQQDGWGAVPSVASIRGTQGTPATAQNAQAGSTAQAGTTAHGAQYAPTASRAPRRKLRRGQLIGIIAGGTAVVLLLVAGVVGYSVGSATHSADRPVRAFLDDLTAGKVADALDAAGIDRTKADVLLTDAAYAKATAKVTGYRVAATRTDGDTATVRAYLRQAGRDVAATFTLDKTGTDWGVFPVWELQAPELGSVDVSVRGPAGASVQVAGTSTKTPKDGSVGLRALPGTYAVTYDGGKWTKATGGSAVVGGFGGSASTPVQMTATLTDAGEQAAKRAVDAWVDGCIASNDAAPAGCSFYAYGENPAYTYTNEKWTLESRPTVAVGSWTTNGWLVSTTTFGRATFTADIAGAGGTGTATAGPLNVNASGYITGFSSSGATFRSAVGNGSSDTGS
ncbi:MULTISPECIES: hypothetical protein [unclassified Curtobacterium]|uniref:hypothetical protein n=1 Tax=unclassified Curtobacterium TaxID=257496 RepID=UPI000F491154|nr:MULTISPECIES: hypothetical protein [unclassified Curtobacterium]ROQ16316.1 hypothetical protein EDF41_0993 [Curtobacterium sp. PhB171]ROQ25608.1 hypothetical protein EDF40_2105 [Curtobacterium sp. PhB170]ROS37060.1 hypothetical protein EDF25_1282 [Curtobacterium sp. PhB131]ROS71736.1 hypothetical protein EDF30_1468 [Curtobacterium sp. PhB141]